MTQIGLAELIITDGTNVVDLLNHFKLANWQPASASYKDGGIFQDSPIADGRRLVQRYFGNLEETFQLVAKTGKINSAIYDINRLKQMLEDAADYWSSDWNDTPVWVEARSPGESNRRYATIVKGEVMQDPNPYAQPFAGPLQSAGLIELKLEHLIWLDVKPTSYNETEIAQRQFNGTFYAGNVDASGDLSPVTDGTCIIGNSDANSTTIPVTYIERVFSDSFAGPPYAELVNAAPSVATPLLDGAVIVGNAIYFGSLVPFSNIVFNLSTAVSGITIGTWEYWDGAAWASLTVTDRTSGLTQLGVKAVVWAMPDDWDLKDADSSGTPRYYVRVKVTAAPGPQVYPVQAAQPIYTASQPFFEIQADQVSGTIPALMRMIQNAVKGTGIDRLLFGLRSYSRGSDFSHFLTITDNSYSKVSSAVTAGTFEDCICPSARRYKYDPAMDGSSAAILITFANPEQWLGRFRVLIRYTSTNNASGYFSAEVKVLRQGAYQETTGLAYLNNATDDYALAGIGALDTKGNAAASELISFGITIFLTASADAISNSAVLYIYDLILLPVDEWSSDSKVEQAQLVKNFILDSLQSRWQSRFFANNATANFDTGVGAIGQTISPGPAILQKQSRQRLHVVAIQTVSNRPSAAPQLLIANKINHQARYHSFRGDQ